MEKKYRDVDRAKQFIPFDALKGLRQAIKAKENIKVDKIMISSDRTDIEDTLQKLKVGDIVKVIFYNIDNYQKITGVVSEINTCCKYLKIVKTRINISDIYEISIV